MDSSANDIEYPNLEDIYENASAPLPEGEDEDATTAEYRPVIAPEIKPKDAFPVVVLYGTSNEGTAEIGNALAFDQPTPFSTAETEEVEMTMGRLSNAMNPTALIVKVPESCEKKDKKFQRIKLLEAVLSQYPESSKTILMPIRIDEKPMKKHTQKSLKLISDIVGKDASKLTHAMVIMTKCQEYCNYRTNLGDPTIKVVEKLRKKHEKLKKKINGTKVFKNIVEYILRYPHVDNPNEGIGMVSSWMVNYALTPAELECYSIQKNAEIEQQEKSRVEALFQAQHQRGSGQGGSVGLGLS